ncbi:DnaJ domain-containing protein [Nemania diffusa]|nr:DnaJ domain-containing protein [Nemania diffusa]
MSGNTCKRVSACIFAALIIITTLYVGVCVLSARPLIETLDEYDILSTPPSYPDYYEILKISIDASDADIKRGYRRQVLKYHPDKLQLLSSSERAGAEENMSKAQEAYEFLLSSKRCDYDREVFRTSLLQLDHCLREVALKNAKAKRDEEAQRRRDRILEEELKVEAGILERARKTRTTTKDRTKAKRRLSEVNLRQSELGLIPSLLVKIIVGPWIMIYNLLGW